MDCFELGNKKEVCDVLVAKELINKYSMLHTFTKERYPIVNETLHSIFKKALENMIANLSV